jgi:hypothetical protein
MSIRGYADWNPKPEARLWVRRTAAVLDEYRDEWPLSVRQLFYRLVAEYGYEKSEGGYGRLTQLLSRARRANMLPWEAIRDGGLGRTVAARYFDGAEDFEATVRDNAANLKLNRQRGQAQVIELWCEAGGMVPILQRIAAPYSCRVNTGGGYDSVTAKHNLAARVRERARGGLRTVILHVGDFDPSGEDMCEVLRGDAGEMATTQIIQGLAATYREGDDGFRGVTGDIWDVFAKVDRDEDLTGPENDRVWRLASGFFTVERVALTADQVIDRQVETAPAKKTDARMAAFVERNAWVARELGTPNISAQLEALTPPELRELISGAIEAHLDMDVFEGVQAEEADVRRDLLARLDGRA